MALSSGPDNVDSYPKVAAMDLHSHYISLLFTGGLTPSTPLKGSWFVQMSLFGQQYSIRVQCEVTILLVHLWVTWHDPIPFF